MVDLKFGVGGLLGDGLVRSLFLTTRSSQGGMDAYLRFRRAGQPVIFVCWHGQLLPLVHHHRGQGVVVLVSEHGDGEYITRILERHGFGTARGSSTRGGVRGLKGLIRACRDGHDLAFTPDGPRGPRCEFKPGALLAAQVTGAPVVPLAAAASAAWYLDSWDRFMVPHPFSRVVVEYGEPLSLPRDLSTAEREEVALRLGGTLDHLTDLARRTVERGETAG